MIEIYTDGATSSNGKAGAKGGAAYIIVKDNAIIKEENFHIPNATNNICELRALIEGCAAAEKLWNIDEFHSTINVYSDSAYCINCYKDEWWRQWEINGWRTASRTPVKNKDLWIELIRYFKNPIFNFIKVAGHSGNEYNERADKLAVAAKNKVV